MKLNGFFKWRNFKTSSSKLTLYILRSLFSMRHIGTAVWKWKIFNHANVSIKRFFETPSTRIRFRLKTQIFLCGLPSRPHVSGEYGHRKRNFSKTLPIVEIFENAVFHMLVWKRNISDTPTSCYGISSEMWNGRRTNHFFVAFSWAFIEPNDVSWDHSGFPEYSSWLREEEG